MAAPIASPRLDVVVGPFLAALPGAAVSTEPPTAVLPLLSPILRQRAQLLSTSSTEPWLRLLCYDVGKVPKLSQVVQSGALDPHPVSGEVEVDWDYDAQVRYRRVDKETLQAFVALSELQLAFQLVYCVGDTAGGGDGWRIGEVTVPASPSPFDQFGGFSSIIDAEEEFEEGKKAGLRPTAAPSNGPDSKMEGSSINGDDDDDGYWDRYDATPARTPAQKRSPAPPAMSAAQAGPYTSHSAEDDYYAQYDDVQPAMDNHDPDEEYQQAQLAPPLGLARPQGDHPPRESEGLAGDLEDIDNAPQLQEVHGNGNPSDTLLHPRPESSASSTKSNMVAKLEEMADKRGDNEFGVKQHVSRSIRSLFMLARASGIDRDEFERLVQTELELLSMVDDNFE